MININLNYTLIFLYIALFFISSCNTNHNIDSDPKNVTIISKPNLIKNKKKIKNTLEKKTVS